MKQQIYNTTLYLRLSRDDELQGESSSIIVGISYNSYIRVHTFTLSGNETVKSEQIQPVNGRVKVNGTVDTEVRFTDVETGKTYEIDYITSGVSETLQLERGKWYEVEGAGELIVRPVNIRIE